VFEEFNGIPMHPLLVHAAVVFVPLLGLAAIGYAFVPLIRPHLRWILAGLAVVAPGAALFAKLSGDAFFSRGMARGNITEGFIPVIEDQRGPADRASPYRQGSVAVRAVTPVAAGLELQANLAAFTDARERGTAFSEIDTAGADGSLRLVGRGALPFSALFYVQVRDFSNQFAAVNADRTVATQTLDQYSVPSTGLGARVELRPLTGPLELRVGADWRETEGRTQELFQFVAGVPSRGRVAGGHTRTIGGFAEAGWERGDLTLSGGGRVDRWWIAQVLWEHRPVAFYTWSGLEQHSGTTQIVRAINVLYALTGCLDAPGGNVLFTPVSRSVIGTLLPAARSSAVR